MVIQNIALTNFRNHRTTEIPLHPKINYFYGDNGSGKTSILEGLYYCTHLKSFRSSEDKKIIGHEDSFSRLKIDFERQSYSLHSLECVITRSEGRKIYFDGSLVRYTSEIIGQVYSLILAADTLFSFKSSPLVRRAYFDRILALLSPVYLSNVQKFHRIKKQKNSALKYANRKEIHTWNKLLAEIIPAITQERKAIAKRINPILSDNFKKFFGSGAELELVYKSQFADKGTEDIFDLLAEKMEAELSSSHSLYGPQRDSYDFQHMGKPDCFSQAEYKVAFLSLQLSIIALIKENLQQNFPVLLDDIFSDLDENIARKLMKFLVDLDCQVMITHTEKPSASALEGNMYRISQGRVL